MSNTKNDESGDRSAGNVGLTRLRAGRPRSHGSIPSRIRSFYVVQDVHSDSRTHPVSCSISISTWYGRQNSCVRTTPDCLPVFMNDNISWIIYYICLQIDTIWLCLTPNPQKLKMYCVVQSPLASWRIWKLVSESFQNKKHLPPTVFIIRLLYTKQRRPARARVCVCVWHRTITVRNKTIILYVTSRLLPNGSALTYKLSHTTLSITT